ncbi:hypothetical protein Rs2_44467 [Raphanus sativus]|nr:hypothetical protein Rs2_48571 [Raphanus sativus]KAJ4871612.1 hypothetical protein Rs2_46746 [Raphanus sativus]KAJ4873785.1 hypothetical protein Rs2_44463 [Raphanus sativus]KAJ4873789.1 hypothetical protein Rs2_44467 [Raphanus sativus]
MYNGIGLQTARGSWTNGYVQTNKFFVRPRNGGKSFAGDQGTAEDELINQGFCDAEIALKLEEARLKFEASAAVCNESHVLNDAKISDTHTHQISAKKEKQMEAFQAALGLRDQQLAEEGANDDEATGGIVK